MSGDAFLPVALVFGYLLGSIPFGLILTKLAGTADLRSIGSGNIGATNVLRTGRKGLAAATLLFDALKGTAAVVIAGYIAGPNAAILAGLGAFLRHLFPVWLKFKGGKGVAVYIGILLGLFWPSAVVCRLLSATNIWSDAPPSPPAPEPVPILPPAPPPARVAPASAPIEIVVTTAPVAPDRPRSRQWPPQKLSLALQGGGAFAAFTWGVL